jgi:hypothetical protein
MKVPAINQRNYQAGLAVMLACLLPVTTLHGLTLEELRKVPDMTPKKFAGHFKDFAFRFMGKLQEPDEFLLSRSGDCDDYAVVADLVLRPRGYDTRLVGIQLVGSAHMVCYVINDKVYLDYNNRQVFVNLTRSDASLRAVATRVARSLNANWTTATEYTYLGARQLRAVATVVKTEPAAQDPGFSKRPEGGIKVDF